MRSNRENYIKRKIYALEKLGNRCTKCGKTENLEFDHIDPTTKYQNVTCMLLRNIILLDKEIEKCQLLCEKCHADKTAAERGYIRSATEHGNLTAYSHRKCRCNECKSFWNNKTKEYKSKKVKNSFSDTKKAIRYGDNVEHGEYVRYRRGCRCDLCKEANTKRMADYRKSKQNALRKV